MTESARKSVPLVTERQSFRCWTLERARLRRLSPGFVHDVDVASLRDKYPPNAEQSIRQHARYPQVRLVWVSQFWVVVFFSPVHP